MTDDAFTMMDNDARKQLLSAIAPRKSAVSPLASVVYLPELDESGLVLEEIRNRLRSNVFSPLSGNTALADLFIVFTTASSSDKDVTCLLTKRKAEGVVFANDIALPGLKVNSFQKIEFENVQIPEQHVLGPRGKALKIMDEARNVFRSFIAAMATGADRCAYQ